ncbi:MAG: hypothetical protein ACM30I_16745 [Gemmatimonas sp.]
MSDQATDKAWIRDWNGKAAVFGGITGADAKVLASVDGEQRIMTRAEWDALPLWSGPDPFRSGRN